jgi:hypothetical protein
MKGGFWMRQAYLFRIQRYRMQEEQACRKNGQTGELMENTKQNHKKVVLRQAAEGLKRGLSKWSDE